MSDDNKQSYAQEVFERGTRVYNLLDFYEGDYVNLYHGDGALPPHPVIQNALREVADNMETWDKTSANKTHIELRRYRLPRIMTMPTLRDAIVNDFAKSMPSTFDETNLVVHTAGGVTHLFAALLNHLRKTNTAILMFAPVYTMYLFSASNMSCNVHLIEPRSDGMITPEHIENSLDKYPDVKYILLVNPNNPTGQYYTHDELETIAHLVFKRNLIVICDEIFHRLVYDPQHPFISIASIEVNGKLMLERTIILRSISKDHGLAAVRSGFAIGWKELMEKLHINWFTLGTIFNVDDLAQYVTIAALSGTPDEYYQDQRDLLRRHRDLVVVLVGEINRTVGYQSLKVTRPSAGMFLIVDCSGLKNQRYIGKVLDSDIILCELLLQKENGGVAFLPTSCGGYDPGAMQLRLTLSSSEKDIKLGMKILGDFVEKVSFFN